MRVFFRPTGGEISPEDYDSEKVRETSKKLIEPMMEAAAKVLPRFKRRRER